jgi:phosphate transport system substrate-binding protein
MSTKQSQLILLVAGLAAILALAGCAKTEPPPASGETKVTDTVSLSKISLNGAGASFPYPIYSKWASKFYKLKGMKLNYQSIGSGGGIAQIKAKTVDFGASDAPMKQEELEAHGLLQFPMIMGGVVPILNIEGIQAGQLKLTPRLISDIYLGKITKWNHSAIRKANPGLNLPDQAITAVRRADGSGTTWIFTNYLSKISEKWSEKVGTGKAVSWPTGVGGKGNEGVATNVQRIKGSIGYVEYAYALQNNISYALLQNQAGNFVAPTIETFQAAAANADWENASGFYMVLTDQPGDQSWPITGASFILLYKEQSDPAKARAMLKFFDWCYRHGADDAKALHYVPMPEPVVNLVEETWRQHIRAGGKSVWE